MLKLYGSPASSSGRTHWLLEEIGLPYDYQRVDRRAGETKRPEFRELNPLGTVPFLIDGEVRLAESMAINQYLAAKYAPALTSTELVEKAEIDQWSYWAISNLQPWLISIMNHVMLFPEPDRDPRALGRAKNAVPEYLQVLDRALAGKSFLVGGRFTIADVNVASVANISRFVDVGLGAFGEVSGWLDRMRERPAYARAAAAG